MASSGPSPLSEALDRLWAQFRPQMDERVAIIEAANRALSAASLTAGERSAAGSAAHKLAGILGTFGLTRGTELAREAELLYSGEPDIGPAALARLTEIAAQLRAMIESRG